MRCEPASSTAEQPSAHRPHLSYAWYYSNPRPSSRQPIGPTSRGHGHALVDALSQTCVAPIEWRTRAWV